MVKSRPATGTDVARHAGVSQATVSVVLSGTRSTSRVSESTRRRVLEAATALGYAPHPSARALRRRRSGVIGFVPHDLRGALTEHFVPHHLHIQIARAAIRHGYHAIEASAETVAGDADGLVAFLLRRRVDGVICYSPGSADEVRQVSDHGLPVVQLLRPQPAAATPTITVDPSPGIDAAIDHLVGLGHRRIAFLGHGGAHPTDRARRDCFAAALARHGLPAPPEWSWLVDAYTLEGGQAATRALLALPERPTALFAAGDNLALGALHALYETRLRVPDNLSLVSYDDILAPQLPPPLTSVAQPLEEVAERAVALIANRLDDASDGAGEGERIVLPTKFVVRASTGPPRNDRG